MANDTLRPVVTGWLEKIKLAKEHKRKNFGNVADECRKFFSGPYTWMYKARATGGRDEVATALDVFDGEGEPIQAPTFQLTINKAAEVVQLFGPALYQQNPDRKVVPRRTFKIPDEYLLARTNPMDAMFLQQLRMLSQVGTARDTAIAGLFELYLNYTPIELDYDREYRLAVDDALITGMGVLWHEIVQHPSGLFMPAQVWENVDTLILDPDAKRLEDCQWIARECIHPVWAVEDEYHWPRGTLAGNRESFSETASALHDDRVNAMRARGQTNDQLVYYKIWSKMGIGGRLKGVVADKPEYKGQLDELGDYCYLAIADSTNWPLNLPEAVWDGEAEQVQAACQWPIPFWLDKGEWPFDDITFHRDPDNLWPMAHLKPALGELKFINWTYSFLTSKIRTASRDVLVMLKGLAEETKRAIKSGPDYSVVEISSLEQSIDKIVGFIQHPQFNPEIYNVLDHMVVMFEKRTGLTDLIYGETARQLRSAEEASIKQRNATIRPDDMSKVVEAAASKAARKEMSAARWVLTEKEVGTILGIEAGYIWQHEVMRLPPQDLFHQFDCRVESGSSQRPNRDLDRQNLQTAMTNIFQPLWEYAGATGNVDPVNALVQAWARSVHLDADKFLLTPMPIAPPAAPPGEPGGEPAEGGPPQ